MVSLQPMQGGTAITGATIGPVNHQFYGEGLTLGRGWGSSREKTRGGGAKRRGGGGGGGGSE